MNSGGPSWCDHREGYADLGGQIDHTTSVEEDRRAPGSRTPGGAGPETTPTRTSLLGIHPPAFFSSMISPRIGAWRYPEVLAPPVPMKSNHDLFTHMGDRSDEILALNAKLRELAMRRGLRYIDYHSALKNAQNSMDKDLAEDGVHPTMKAYSIMGKLLLQSLK